MSHIISKGRSIETYPNVPKSGSGVMSVTAPNEGSGIAVDNTDPQNPKVSNAGVRSVRGTSPVVVDNTDPQNPIAGLETPNVIQGVDQTGGSPIREYDFAQSFTPGARGVLVIASTSFSTGTPGDTVHVWLENDNNPGVTLNNLTLQSSGSGLQCVTIHALDSPTPNEVTYYRIFVRNSSPGGTVTVPAFATSVLISGF